MIKFGNNQHNQYLYLAPSSPHSFTLEGKEWPSVEHYYQAMKYHNTDLEEQIRMASTTIRARLIANRSKNTPRGDWKDVREKLMYKALHAKFSQHENLKRKLLGSDVKELVFTSRTNPWLIDDNRYGKLLMRLRKHFERKENPTELETEEEIDTPQKPQPQQLQIEKVLDLMLDLILTSQDPLSFQALKTKIPVFNTKGSSAYQKYEPYLRRFALQALQLKELRGIVVKEFSKNIDQVQENELERD